MSDKLLECPFCGGHARLQEGKRGYEIRCSTPDCGASLYGFNILDNAIEAWNRRTPPRDAAKEGSRDE